MAINYQLRKKPANLGAEVNNEMYPLAISERTINKKELTERMAAGSTLTCIDAEAALSALGKVVAYELSQGNRVELPGLGIFSPSLQLDKDVTDGNYLHDIHLKVNKINFRANKTLLYECQRYGFNQMKNTRIELSEQERWAQLSTYLQENSFINISKYRRLVNVSFRRATADLENGCRRGLLKEQAMGKIRMFMLKAK